MRKIITINEKDQWITYLKKSYYYDFYHSWIYHSLERTSVPFLFVYEVNDCFIALPLIKRVVPYTDFFDLTSAYGFVGPIASKDFDEIPLSFLNEFKESFNCFLIAENIISIFSTLHPFLNQEILLRHFGGVWDNGKIVIMDLDIPLRVQRTKYAKAYSKIRQLKGLGYSLKEGKSIADIQAFIAIYRENMSRVNASQSYWFDEEYITALLDTDEYDANLYFIINKEGNPICGTIIICTNNTMQGYLLATKEEYRALSPAKLLVDEITLVGREKGVKFYNLGGGLAYKEDSLYKWKLLFSNTVLTHKSWRYIVDPTGYQIALNRLDIDPKSTVDFFPLYRTAL